jgi:hypothetical protein
MKELAITVGGFVAKSLWLLAISPVVIPALLISFLVTKGDNMDIGGGLAFGATMVASMVGITALYIGLGIGYLL